MDITDRLVNMIIRKNLIITVLTLSVFCSSIMFSTNVSAGAIGKVTKVKKTVVNKSYKEIVDASLRLAKVKYKAGYKISWKKMKNVDGYKIYYYCPASKQWKLVKTTKKNKYTVTNLFAKEKVKIKVRAFVNKDDQLQYGAYSKSITINNKQVLTVRDSRGKTKKPFYDRIAAENAFVTQNKMRKSAGSNNLKWSEALYEVCLQRAKEISNNYSHDGWDETAFDVLNKKYGIEDEYVYYKSGTQELGEPYVCSENIAGSSNNYKDVMKQWKDSSGHYRNMVGKEHKSGAIACYYTKKGAYWVALFSNLDVDELLNK